MHGKIEIHTGQNHGCDHFNFLFLVGRGQYLPYMMTDCIIDCMIPWSSNQIFIMQMRDICLGDSSHTSYS